MARNTGYVMGYIAVKEENRVQIATLRALKLTQACLWR